MIGRIQKQGHYELFEDGRGKELLVLNDDNENLESWYSIFREKEIVKMIITKVRFDDPRTQNLTQQGHFYLAVIEDDPDYPGFAHLYLQDEKGYEEFVLPEGIASLAMPEKLVIPTNKWLRREQVENYLIYEAD